MLLGEAKKIPFKLKQTEEGLVCMDYCSSVEEHS